METNATDDEIRQRIAFLELIEEQTRRNVYSPAQRTRILNDAFPPVSHRHINPAFVQWPPAGEVHPERRIPAHAQ